MILLQACGGGGGGGGGPSMTECMTGEVRDSGDNECRAPETDAECMELDAMMPVFVGDECRAECGEGQTRNMTTHACETSMPMPVTCTDPTPFSHNGACVATCPPEALIPNNGVCEPATSAAECMGADSTLMFLHSGTCVAECPDEALIPNNGVCEPATSAAECMGADSTLMFLDSGTCVAECPATASVSHNGACMATCPDAASVSHNGACRATCPTTASVSHNSVCMEMCPDAASVSHNSVCMEMCPDAAPMPGTNNVCRLREARDCPDARPVFVDGTSPCRAARNVTECHDTLPVFEQGACVATATPPDLLRMEDVTGTPTHNYDALDLVGENRPAIVGSDTLRTGITHGRNAPERREPDTPETTADRVDLTQGAAGSGFTSLTITDTGRSGATFTWTVADNQRTERLPAPMIVADAADRRARPLIADSDGIRIGGIAKRMGGGIGWSYPTFALNSADLLGDAAGNPSDDAIAPVLLNFRAAVVEWTDTTDNYYMAGGVWGYDTADTRTATSEIVGAFADGDFTDITPITDPDTGATNLNPGNPLPTDDSTATYTGHSFGTYATLPAAEGEGNRGFFAAEVKLDVTFSSVLGAGVSNGTITNFLFSGRGTDANHKLDFRDEAQSLLENALEVTVMLGTTSTPNNRFRAAINSAGTDSTATLRFPDPDDNVTVQLRGEWGGSFFGQGHDTQDGTVPAQPPGIGGTWAASGQTDDEPGSAEGGFGISFIGSFGAKLQP